MAAVLKPAPYNQELDGIHGLSVAHKADNPRWMVYAEVRGKSLEAIVFEAHEITHSPPYYSQNLDTKPAPYTIAITTHRFNRRTIKQDEPQVWLFSGAIKAGGDFRLPLGAFIDAMKDADDTPYNMYFNVRIRSERSLQVDNANTASEPLNIGNSSYELVSKEIMSLHSAHFKALYYGDFAESGNEVANYRNRQLQSLASKKLMQPLDGEDVKDFEKAMRMLLEWAHYKTFNKVTPLNAPLLISILERFQFRAIDKHLDAALALYCSQTMDYKMWDAAILLSQEHDFPETERRVPTLYKISEEVIRAIKRMRHKLTAENILRFFDAHCRSVENSNRRRTNYVYFKFVSGRAIVQLNRVGVPLTTAALIDDFAAPAPGFDWDHKGRLISDDPVPIGLRCHGECVDHRSVPDGAWALLIRQPKALKDGPHYILTKTRPHGLYLGFVVKGEQHLNENLSCDRVGLLQVEI